MELSVPSFLHSFIPLVLLYAARREHWRIATIHYTVMYIGAPLRSAKGALTQRGGSNVYLELGLF